MAEKIQLDQAKREVVRGLGKDSIIAISKTSAADVYVNAVTPDDTVSLHEGDSSAYKRLTRVRLHVFRNNAGDPNFSATIDIADAPAP